MGCEDDRKIAIATLVMAAGTNFLLAAERVYWCAKLSFTFLPTPFNKLSS